MESTWMNSRSISLYCIYLTTLSRLVLIHDLRCLIPFYLHQTAHYQLRQHSFPYNFASCLSTYYRRLCLTPSIYAHREGLELRENTYNAAMASKAMITVARSSGPT